MERTSATTVLWTKIYAQPRWMNKSNAKPPSARPSSLPPKWTRWRNALGFATTSSRMKTSSLRISNATRMPCFWWNRSMPNTPWRGLWTSVEHRELYRFFIVAPRLPRSRHVVDERSVGLLPQKSILYPACALHVKRKSGKLPSIRISRICDIFYTSVSLPERDMFFLSHLYPLCYRLFCYHPLHCRP